ncbi:DNA mismatch endonuclease, patch repair protein [Nitrosospira briensis]|uniref:Very short patch repair endonuclease n=1 Tax=Nitrosospira briensis TaxID=35799 RepID=A0A1I5FD04_9PROT|nr:DNA mismatch endonuclease Vsr [Nitrosospira briensis]SFO21503.1 DNA mismatch endonuclease, patch repair protein [Nitrosospira briensis]
MTDIVDAATRSRMMSGIRAINTKPELHVRSLLHRQGFRFRLHVRDLPGKPDIVLPRHHAVIFVHGCFWHGHDCPLFRIPSTRPDFWQTKIDRNRENDHRATAALNAAGWRTLTVWECAIRGRRRLDDVALTGFIDTWLRSNNPNLELAASPEGEK